MKVEMILWIFLFLIELGGRFTPILYGEHLWLLEILMGFTILMIGISSQTKQGVKK